MNKKNCSWTLLIGVQIFGLFFLSFFLVFHLLLCLSFPLSVLLPVSPRASVCRCNCAECGPEAPGRLSANSSPLAPSPSQSRLSVCQLLRLIGSHLISASLSAMWESAATALPFSRVKTPLQKKKHRPLQDRTTVSVIRIIIIRRISAFFWRQTDGTGGTAVTCVVLSLSSIMLPQWPCRQRPLCPQRNGSNEQWQHFLPTEWCTVL